MNKIQSFKTFSQIKEEEKNQQLQEETKSKRDQLVTKIAETLVEMDITSFDELSEEEKKTLVAKLFNEESEVEITTKGDVELEINQEEEEESEDKIKSDEEVEEGNDFIHAAAKAKADGKDEFEFDGKKYKVTLKADTGLKESYQLLITEATRWQFGKIDKRGNITSTYVHYDGYPDAVIPNLDKYDSKTVDQVLKDAEMGGMSSLGKNPKQNKYYNDSKTSTLDSGDIKNIRKYLKHVGDEAGAEYVYLYDERDGQWYGADVFTDKELKPVEQLDESVIFESKNSFKFKGRIKDLDSQIGKDYYIETTDDEDTYDVIDVATKKWVGNFHFDGKKVTLLDMPNNIFESVVNESKINYDFSERELIRIIKVLKRNSSTEIKMIKAFEKALGRKITDKELWESNADESVITEAKGFKNTKDFESFLKEIDSMPEAQIKKIMGKDYIDTPGFYEDEKDDYEDVIDFMMSNMGRADFNELKDWWESNVQESVINESEIKSNNEFKEYAFTVLQKAFGEDFDEAKAEEVVDGLISKYSGDYGAMVGALQSSLD